jgi:hypothetical protein
VILREQEKREYAQLNEYRRGVRRAPSKSRCRRGREPPEEAAGQAAAVVDHDRCGEQASGAGLIWNHFKFLTQGLRLRQSID